MKWLRSELQTDDDNCDGGGCGCGGWMACELWYEHVPVYALEHLP